MMSKIKPVLNQLNWQQARVMVQQVNPALAAIIDELDPAPDYKLFELTSSFGEEILREGLLHLPDKQGEMLSIRDPHLSSNLRDELGYSLGGNPLALMLQGSAELFLPVKNHSVVFVSDILAPGKLFGDRRLLGHAVSHHPAFSWHITIGARSLFMLPKITSAANYKRVKNHFKIRFEAPNSLADHWQIFCKLANHPDFGQPWSGQVLYFGKKWLEHLDDKAWARFNYFLYKNAWDDTAFWRDQPLWELAFSLIQQQSNLRPDPYIADTVKYLIAMGIGAVPGFVPAVDNDCGPISQLQTVFKEVYQLDLYEPIIMRPAFLDWRHPPSSVYYSLNYPTTTEFSPRARKLSNKIVDLGEIRYLINQYMETIASNKLHLAAAPITQLHKKISFDYFHSDSFRNEGIQPTSDIPLGDANFLLGQSADAFPSESPFINGCVRVKSGGR